MIINKEHKIIFIHIPRTGGTSIRRLFDFPLNGFQNYGHKIKQSMGEEVYNKYYKFSIVRNPWDRMVSMYHFLRDDPIGNKYPFPGGLKDNESFKDWIMRRFSQGYQRFPKGNLYSFKWLSDWDTKDIIVDKILKFENYSEELQPILNKCGIPAPIPHENKSTRKPYQEYYDEESKEIVGKNFYTDCVLFGYEFDKEDLQPMVKRYAMTPLAVAAGGMTNVPTGNEEFEGENGGLPREPADPLAGYEY